MARWKTATWPVASRLIATFSVLMAAAAASAAETVPWVDDLATARQMAETQNRLLLIHFSAPDCPPCRRLERTVFTEAIFGHGVARNFVPVRVDAKASPDLARAFGVDRWPTDVVVTPAGQILHRMVSPQSTSDYLTALNAVAWRHQNSNPAAQVASASPFGSNSPSGEVNYNSNQGTPEFVQPNSQTNLWNGGAGMAAQAPAPQVAAPPTSIIVTNPNVAPSAYLGGTAAAGGSPPPYGAYPQQIANSNNPPANPDAQMMSAYGQAGNSQVIQNGYAAVPSPPSANNGYGHVSNYDQSNASMPANQPPVPPDFSANAAPPWGAPTNGAPPPEIRTATAPSDTSSAANSPHVNPGIQRVSATASDKPKMGMDGFCPVTLLEEDTWTRGDSRWGAKHRGRVYLFQSAVAQQRFLADPDKYSPALAGYDPVSFAKTGHYVDGTRAHGVRYKDGVYLFQSEESLAEFWKAPDIYIEPARHAIRAADSVLR